jgi:cytochrome c oxidase subunit 2
MALQYYQQVAAQTRRGLLTLSWLLASIGLASMTGYAQPAYPAAPSGAQPRGTPSSQRPAVLDEVGIDQHLNAAVPLDLTFRDETGKTVKLGDYFGQKPVVLMLVYYDCPQLCNQVLSGFVVSLRGLKFVPGEQFNVVTVSFDPKESPDLAARKKDSYIKSYGRPQAAAGWHFLTGNEAEIKALASTVGFRYTWDEATRQYAHASGIMVATPDGRLSRYLYGIEYAPRDLRLGLVEASEGKIGSLADQVLLLCYHYDPTTGKYGLIIMNLLRVGGVLTLIGLMAMWLIFRAKNRGSSKMGYSHNAFAPLAFFQVPFAPEQASSFAPEVDLLYLVLVALTIVVAVGIAGLEFYFAIKYRRRSATEIPGDIHEPKILEIAWIVVPLIVFMGLFFWSAALYFKLYRPPQEALEIFITGKQWMWRAQHPDGQREINALHLPLNRRIKLTMTSEDVLHAYFIPAFRTKADVLPGRYTTIWFETTKTGVFHLFCAEYCGSYHSGMIGKVTVLEPAAYQSWLSGGETSGGSPVQAGQKLFASLACNTCHKSDGAGRGPALEGQFGQQVTLDSGQKVLADEAYVRESILNPRAKVVAGFEPVMPTFQGQISEENILQLIAYIKSIGAQKKQDGTQAAAPKPGTTSATPAAAPGATPKPQGN